MPEPEEPTFDLNSKLSKIIGVVVRRRWWIFLPACGFTLAAIAVLLYLPNRYTSEATLLVVQQQVPQRYVVPNSTTDLSSALEAMKQEVLSRSRLLKMIDDFGLYADERTRLAPEQVVSLMLKSIEITPLGERTQQKDFDAFKIAFTTKNAILAQQVTSTLTALFINENLRMKEEQATNTTNFLHEQVEAKGKKLEEQEERLRNFKLQHVGELPEQQTGNLGILTGLQTQLQNTMSNLSRAQQQQVYLESLLTADSHQPAGNNPQAPQAAATGPTPLEVARNEVARLETAKAALLAKYTPEHPDVMKTQRELERAQDTLRQIQTVAARSSAIAPQAAIRTAPQPADPTQENTVAQVRSQLQANRVEIENLSKEERQLKGAVAQYENRLNQTPVREQQQAGIIRETEALRQEYADLQKKEQESQLATNLEKQQGGQQFRLVDPASLPAVPSSPKRKTLSLIGAAAGLVLGIGLALLMEMRDTSFHTENQIAAWFDPAPFVLGIPDLPTPAERQKSILRTRLEWVAASTLLAAVSAAELFVYKRG